MICLCVHVCVMCDAVLVLYDGSKVQDLRLIKRYLCVCVCVRMCDAHEVHEGSKVSRPEVQHTCVYIHILCINTTGGTCYVGFVILIFS